MCPDIKLKIEIGHVYVPNRPCLCTRFVNFPRTHSSVRASFSSASSGLPCGYGFGLQPS